MCGRSYLDIMHVDYANLVMWYLSIRWSDLKTGNTVAIVRISRSFLWYAMNELMHVMQRPNDAWDEIMIFGVHGWLFKSFSLIKSWVQNRVSTGIFKDLKVKLLPFIWIGMWTNGGNGWRRCIVRRRLKSLGKNFKRSCWSDLGQLRWRILMRLCLEYVKGGHLGTTNKSLRD